MEEASANAGDSFLRERRDRLGKKGNGEIGENGWGSLKGGIV